MDELLSDLSHALSGAPLVALATAFLWGVLRILLSPCHLASIPLIVGFIDRQGPVTSRRACLVSALFATWTLVTIAAVGFATSLAGRMWGDLGPGAGYFVAAVLFLVGLHLLDVIPLPLRGKGAVGFRRKGLLPAFILGLVFGIALGPCTFAYMAPVLAITFRTAARGVVFGALLLVVYGSAIVRSSSRQGPPRASSSASSTGTRDPAEPSSCDGSAGSSSFSAAST